MADAKYLLVGSTEEHSGKSTTILGLTHLFLEHQISIAYGKPLGTYVSEQSGEIVEEDLNFLSTTLGLSADRVCPPLLSLDRHTSERRLKGEDTQNYAATIQERIGQTDSDLILLEGAKDLSQGSLFNLSVSEIAEAVDASILLVARYNSLSLVSSLLTAKKFLGDRLIGVSIGGVPISELQSVRETIKPFLERQDIPVLGIIPQDNLLRAVSVGELARRLDAKVLCCHNHLNWLVESLSIGAMNVNSALEFFRQRENMAVITGGDRTELQLAALETSTHCLILTGRTRPQPLILNRAEDLQVPVLSVDSDTLTTVEVVDRSFGTVPIHEPIKVQRVRELMEKHFDIERLIDKLGLKSAVIA